MPLKQEIYVFETDSIIDIDGNVYKTVKIGDQWWMAENLKVRHYRNNTSIYYNSSMTGSIWASLNTGAYCYLNDREQFNGNLYNWYAVNNTNGLAPEGWRIPTDEDWKKLEIFVGMNPDTVGMTGWRGRHEGEKLKARLRESYYWTLDISINNTDESGFSALPGGIRLYDGSFGDALQNNTGFWWSSTEIENGQIWYRYLDYKYGGVFRYYTHKSSGLSVRCIKIE